MGKSMLSFLLVLTLVVGAFSAVSLPVSAAAGVTEAQVTAKLAEAEEIWPDGEAYIDRLDDGCTLCYGFVRELFEYLFGAPLPRMWTVSTATFDNMQNVMQVGHLSSGYSLDEAEALLAKALPGDVLIASNGGTNHGVIVRSADKDGAGIFLYDANWGRTASGEPVLRANGYWSAEQLHSTRPTAITIYRYANYAGGLTQIPEPAQVHLEKINHYIAGQFTDVSTMAWYAGSIAEAYELGLMSGVWDGIFNPGGKVSIAQAVAMAARVHNLYTRGGALTGTSAGGQWYQTYLDYAYQNGIIGKGLYESDVTKTATRAQFAEIFANALPKDALYEINRISDNAIPDVKMNSAYAESVYTLYRAGILSGTDEGGTFSPQNSISRAEAACVISRMANSDNRIPVTL